MEVSTVSPPPTSPTEGDDPFGVDVIDSAMLLISLCGLAGNGAIIWLLRFSIRRKPITVYIFHLAITDFIFLTIFTLFFLLGDKPWFSVVPLNFLRFLLVLALFYDMLGPCLLAAISFERCRSTFCPLRCHCHHPQHLWKVVSAMLMAFSLTVIPTLFSLFQFDENKKLAVFVHFMAILHLLVFAFSTIISTCLFIKVKCGSQHQQLERLDIIIILMVLFGLPTSISNFLCQLTYVPLPSHVVLLLACIHSTSKPFIYFSGGSCGRHCSMGSIRLSLLRVLGEPEENTACNNDAAMDTEV